MDWHYLKNVNDAIKNHILFTNMVSVNAKRDTTIFKDNANLLNLQSNLPKNVFAT